MAMSLSFTSEAIDRDCKEFIVEEAGMKDGDKNVCEADSSTLMLMFGRRLVHDFWDALELAIPSRDIFEKDAESEVEAAAPPSDGPTRGEASGVDPDDVTFIRGFEYIVL